MIGRAVLRHYARYSVRVSPVAYPAIRIATGNRQKERGYPWRKFIECNQVQAEPLQSECDDWPGIVLFISVGPKDAELVDSVISAVLTNSLNPVTQVMLLIDGSGRFPTRDHGVPVTTIHPHDLLAPDLVAEVQGKFRARAGWVTQQFTKLSFAHSSEANGVLAVDADTFLTKKRGFLDRTGRQVLLPTWDYHEPYLSAIKKLDVGFANLTPANLSYVCHHMLYQPDLVRGMVLSLGYTSILDLFRFAITSCSAESQMSPFSLDYELYGQWITRYRRDRFVLARWSNAAVSRGDPLIAELTAGDFSCVDYASVSFHHYI